MLENNGESTPRILQTLTQSQKAEFWDLQVKGPLSRLSLLKNPQLATTRPLPRGSSPPPRGPPHPQASRMTQGAISRKAAVSASVRGRRCRARCKAALSSKKSKDRARGGTWRERRRQRKRPGNRLWEGGMGWLGNLVLCGSVWGGWLAWLGNPVILCEGWHGGGLETQWFYVGGGMGGCLVYFGRKTLPTKKEAVTGHLVGEPSISNKCTSPGSA